MCYVRSIYVLCPGRHHYSRTSLHKICQNMGFPWSCNRIFPYNKKIFDSILILWENIRVRENRILAHFTLWILHLIWISCRYFYYCNLYYLLLFLSVGVLWRIVKNCGIKCLLSLLLPFMRTINWKYEQVKVQTVLYVLKKMLNY